MPELLKFRYKNHRGAIEDRTVQFQGVHWLDNPGHGYQPGFFLHGHCVDRNAPRSFALCNIILPDDRGGIYRLVRPQHIANPQENSP